MAKNFGHKVNEVEYCAGFVDHHGHWNNGFHCPKHELPAGGVFEYCCGNDTQRFCCIEKDHHAPTTFETLPEHTHNRAPLLAFTSAALALLLLLGLLCMCYWCKGCPLYHRRKKRKLECSRDRPDVCSTDWSAAYANEFVLLPGQGNFYPGGILLKSLGNSLTSGHYNNVDESGRPVSNCDSSGVYETIAGEVSPDSTLDLKNALRNKPSPVRTVIDVTNYVINDSPTNATHDQSFDDERALLPPSSASTQTSLASYTSLRDRACQLDCSNSDECSRVNSYVDDCELCQRFALQQHVQPAPVFSGRDARFAGRTAPQSQVRSAATSNGAGHIRPAGYKVPLGSMV